MGSQGTYWSKQPSPPKIIPPIVHVMQQVTRDAIPDHLKLKIAEAGTDVDASTFYSRTHYDKERWHLIGSKNTTRGWHQGTINYFQKIVPGSHNALANFAVSYGEIPEKFAHATEHKVS